jgi:hypothetical protein
MGHEAGAKRRRPSSTEQPTKNHDLLGHLFCRFEVLGHLMPLQQFLDLEPRFVERQAQLRLSIWFAGVEPPFELRSCDRRLPAPIGNHLPKPVTKTKPDLFLIEVREPDDDRDGPPGSCD